MHFLTSLIIIGRTQKTCVTSSTQKQVKMKDRCNIVAETNNILQSTPNVAMSDDTWRKCELPVNLRELGILLASDMSVCITSVTGSVELTSVPVSCRHCSCAGVNGIGYARYVTQWQSITNLSPGAMDYRPMQKIQAYSVLSFAPNSSYRSAPSSGYLCRLSRLDDASKRIAVALQHMAPCGIGASPMCL
jgi:hypothetical protein